MNEPDINMSFPAPVPIPVEVVPTAPTETDCSASSMTDEILLLKRQGYTSALATSLITSTRLSYPLRIWVVDNSGSMGYSDGTRIVDGGSPSNFRIVSSTRWNELRDTVEYHIDLADLMKAPTIFRILNNSCYGCPPNITVGDGKSSDDSNLTKSWIRKYRPEGCTPLTDHIIEIRNQISVMAPSLRQNGQRVAVVLATDGIPSNNSGISGKDEQETFISALRSLEGLPVWVVVRLCTNDENVTEFYNNLDSQVELSMEVIDDFLGEAHEVHKKNPWLNYCLPLHRVREFGFHDKLFDLLDERQLMIGDLLEFCIMLFGDESLRDHDPAVDWEAFSKKIEQLLACEARNYDPIKKIGKPWINVKKMNEIYAPPKSCTVM